MSSSVAAPSVTAPKGNSYEEQAAAFASDDRIHFSKVTGTWQFEADDGTEMEWDASKGAWVPLVDEDLVKAQQAVYSVPGVDEETPAAPVLKRTSKKRKAVEDYTSNTGLSEAGYSINRGKSHKSSTNDSKEPRPSKNTAVYVTGLPFDTTSDELVSRFSKCGVIMEDDNGQPKVKLYAKDNGSFNGEALVVFFREESVSLALSILDDAELRLGEPDTRMRVQIAQFDHKKQDNKATTEPPPRTLDKKKVSKRIGKMQRKLEDWGEGDDEFGPSLATSEQATIANKSRVVVLKHMFTLEELAADPTLIIDLKEDVREECSSLGEVTNVVLYDEEPEGVITAKFREPLAAQACVLKMHGRFFAGRQVEATLFDGRQRFKRSGGAGNALGDEDTEEAEKKRLDDFANWLMTEGE